MQSTSKKDEPDEVEDEGIDDLVRQRILLVEQDANEERMGAGVVHAGEVSNSCTRVNHRDRRLGKDGR